MGLTSACGEEGEEGVQVVPVGGDPEQLMPLQVEKCLLELMRG